MMKISVIVSTYNSPGWLEKTLWSYEHQSFQDFELLVADDGSAPETGQLIKDFGNRVRFQVRHIWHEDDGFQKWKIVNNAITEASGDYLVFTDGDCVAHPGLLEVHHDRAQPGHFLTGGYCRLPMATSRAISRSDISSNRAFQLRWLYSKGYKPTIKWAKVIIPGSPQEGIFNRFSLAAATFNGNNSSCFRTDAIRVKGFDTRIGYGGGDREFGYRLENSGIEPIVIRYSTLCLHLDHKRGYKNPEVRAANNLIIESTKSKRSERTAFGIA